MTVISVSGAGVGAESVQCAVRILSGVVSGSSSIMSRRGVHAVQTRR